MWSKIFDETDITIMVHIKIKSIATYTYMSKLYIKLKKMTLQNTTWDPKKLPYQLKIKKNKKTQTNINTKTFYFDKTTMK